MIKGRYPKIIGNDLLEKLNEEMFENIDFDEILDLRDIDLFDREWNRIYEVVEKENKIKGYSEENKQLCIRF